LTIGGMLLGLAAAPALTRLLGNILYNVSPLDPLAFGFAIAIMSVVSLLACLTPALGAARSDPMLVLRTE